MLLKREELLDRVDKGTIDPVYYFYGQERFLIYEAIERIRGAFLGGHGDGYQYYHLYGDEVSIEELIELLTTVPFGKSKRRMVCFRPTGRLNASDKDLINAYCDRPMKETVLLLISDDADLRTSFFKALKEKTILARFYPLFENQIPSWIKRQGKRIEIDITQDAAQLMVDLVGKDLDILWNELQKIAIYLHPKKRIGDKDIEDVIGNIRVFSIFELIRSLGEKEQIKSINILKQLLESGQSPIGMIALIAKHFHRLHNVKILLEKGKSQTEISKDMGITSMFVKEYIQQSRIFTMKEIKDIFRLLLETDLQLKGSSLSHLLILKSLVFKICTPDFLGRLSGTY